MAEMPRYDDLEFWNRRYLKHSETFEWYQNYGDLRRLLRDLVPREAAILQIGVGSSTIQAEMVEDGYTSITSTDFSQVAIESLSMKHESLSALTYRVSDCRNMPEFENESFDYVFDKGTLDAQVCSQHATEFISKTMRELYRILRPGGAYLCITYGPPGVRLSFLSDKHYPFLIRIYALAKPGWDLDDTDSSSSDTGFSQTRFMGPFDVEDPVQQEKLLELRDVQDKLHWLYFCHKSTEAPPPPPHSPTKPELGESTGCHSSSCPSDDSTDWNEEMQELDR